MTCRERKRGEAGDLGARTGGRGEDGGGAVFYRKLCVDVKVEALEGREVEEKEEKREVRGRCGIQ